MSFFSLLNTTCDVQRATLKQTDMKTSRQVWTNMSGYTSIPCRIEILSSTERVILGREGVQATHRIYIAAGYTVTEADRIVCGSSTYDLISVLPYQGASVNHHTELIVILRT